MRYRRLVNEAELLDALSDHGTAILSGGTDLLVKIRAGLAHPAALLDISRIPTLLGIRRAEDVIEIGSAVRLSSILASPIVKEHLPLLSTVLSSLGSAQIRHRGTLGGNLVNASPAADSAVPLLLYNAQLDLVGPRGERTLPLDQFLLGPGMTALDHGEFVRTIKVPLPPQQYHPFYHKVGRRRALTIAIASVGLLLHADTDHIVDIRIAAGSVAPTPIRLLSAEASLRGSALTAKAITETARRAIQSVSPITDIRATAAYRQHVVGELITRALQAINP